MNKIVIGLGTRRFHQCSLIYGKNRAPHSIGSAQFISNSNKSPHNSIKKALDFMQSSSLDKKRNTTDDGYDKLHYKESKPGWEIQKDALKRKFQGSQWNPPKKLSRQEMESIRVLRDQFPTMSASDLASHFKISPEAVRRILKTKWRPNEDDLDKIESRWNRRGQRIKEMYNQKGDGNSDSKIEPVLRLKYNPNENITDYYLTNKSSQKQQELRSKTLKRNKFHLLHKLKN